MIDTEIFNIKYTEGLTKFEIENYFLEKKLKVIKWAIVGIKEGNAKILTSFLKKF